MQQNQIKFELLGSVRWYYGVGGSVRWLEVVGGGVRCDIV